MKNPCSLRLRLMPALAVFSIASISPAQVNVNVGNLPAGKTLVIQFDATINNPLPPGVTFVSAQGLVTGSNFAPVLTDDPSTAGAGDPTITLVTVPPEAMCQDVTVPADVICEANVSPAQVDNGSFDPDGGSVTLVSLTPQGRTRLATRDPLGHGRRGGG